MFRMILAAIAELANVIRINAMSLNNLSASGYLKSVDIIQDQLESMGNVEETQAQLRAMGLTAITELPKPQPKAPRASRKSQ